MATARMDLEAIACRREVTCYVSLFGAPDIAIPEVASPGAASYISTKSPLLIAIFQTSELIRRLSNVAGKQVSHLSNVRAHHIQVSPVHGFNFEILDQIPPDSNRIAGKICVTLTFYELDFAGIKSRLVARQRLVGFFLDPLRVPGQ